MTERSRGWLLVTGLFLVMTVSSGLGFYSLAVYMNALAAEKGFTVSAISGAVALVFVMSGFAGLVVGRLLERFDPRWVITGGASLGGIALALVGVVDELWQLYFVYAVYGIGMSGVSMIPGTVLITRRFSSTRRSVAMSLATQGLSAGGVVLTPLAAVLIGRSGLEFAMPVLGLAFFLGIVPVAWFTIRPWPSGYGTGDGGNSMPADNGSHYGVAVRSRFFIFVTSAYVLIMLAHVGVIAHQFNLVAGRVDGGTAAGSVSVLTACSIIGRFLAGWTLTWMPTRRLAFVSLLISVVGIVWLGAAQTPLTLLLASALFGFTVGTSLMLQSLLLAEAFGVRDYGRIFSLSQLLTTIGVAGGPLTLGVLHDATGGYLASFVVAALAATAALALLACAGPVPDGEMQVMTSETL